MQATCFLLLAVAQALRAKSLYDDQHGVHVSELNTDVDYRDFNETVDLATEASKKAPTHYGGFQPKNMGWVDIGTTEHNDKNGFFNKTVFIEVEHDIFPVRNMTYEPLKDCGGNINCSVESYRWFQPWSIDNSYKFLMFLTLLALCLIIMTVLKLKLILMRNWGYSPALMDDRTYELRMYRANTRSNQQHNQF